MDFSKKTVEQLTSRKEMLKKKIAATSDGASKQLYRDEIDQIEKEIKRKQDTNRKPKVNPVKDASVVQDHVNKSKPIRREWGSIGDDIIGIRL